jgi:Tfp pilus assembly protein PilX
MRGGSNVTSGDGRNRGDAGFALIVALLALVLLTFLGLTLATTTSTELQISTNYRWSQQALYNAEGGLEVARAVLSQVGDGQLVLPAARLTSWDPALVPNPVPPTNMPAATQSASRNFESSACDTWGNGAGFGQVLVDPASPGTPFQNVSTALGQRLTGNFTVWVRRDLVFNADGTMSDSPLGENVIVTAEGAAPFMDRNTPFMRANQAIRRLESRVVVREGCRPSGPQASDTGFSGCDNLP